MSFFSSSKDFFLFVFLKFHSDVSRHGYLLFTLLGLFGSLASVHLHLINSGKIPVTIFSIIAFNPVFLICPFA